MKVDIFLAHTRYFQGKSADSLLGYLNEDEIKRSHQFRQVRDKEVFILSRVLLKIALERYRPDVPLRSWKFSTNRYGKPFIFSPALKKSIYFNLSHTTATAAVAISSYCNLGVDIEKIRDPGSASQTSYLDISQNFFTQQEAVSIAALPRDEGQLLFWKLWTLKEAYIKYRGKGLSLGLDCIEFAITKEKITSRYSGSPVYFSQWQLGDSILAFASPLACPEIILHSLTEPSELYYDDEHLLHRSDITECPVCSGRG